MGVTPKSKNYLVDWIIYIYIHLYCKNRWVSFGGYRIAESKYFSYFNCQSQILICYKSAPDALGKDFKRKIAEILNSFAELENSKSWSSPVHSTPIFCWLTCSANFFSFSDQLLIYLKKLQVWQVNIYPN